MMLQVEELSFTRGSAEQAFRVEIPSLSLGRGEMIAFTGESGSGKSTALELLGLVVRPHTGCSFRMGVGATVVDIARLWSRNDQDGLARIRAAALGFVLQTGGLLPYLSVTGNIRVNRRLLGLPDEDEDVEVLIDSLKIRDLLHKKPSQLSVGQQQRASIARALAHKPRLLLADEPTSALDPRLGDQVMDLMLGLVERLNTSVLLATHEHDRVRAHGLREVAAEPLDGALGSRFEG
jgi:putative ABC transport system ATP-binding protein